MIEIRRRKISPDSWKSDGGRWYIRVGRFLLTPSRRDSGLSGPIRLFLIRGDFRDVIFMLPWPGRLR